MGANSTLFGGLKSMKYKIEENDEVFDTIDEAIDYCIDEDWHWDDDYFEEWVNDTEDHVTINGNTYYPYDILEHCDDDNLTDLHRAYCESCNSDDADEARRELERSEPGDQVECQGYIIRVLEDYEYEETGDMDGDEALETLRKRLQEIEAANIETQENEKKTENDLLNMFQIVGG